MRIILRLCLIFLVLCLSHCRDYYIGMFKRNDFLVAQDRLFKEKVPYRRVIAKYGRVFKCPITYFRIVDRLGYGGGPRVEVTRGGLLKNYIVARLTSPYNLPISVNVYVGCENKMVRTKPTTMMTTKAAEVKDEAGNSTDPTGDKTVIEGAESNSTGIETTAAADGADEATTTAPAE